MKYAFISDIHSNLPAIEAVLEDIEKRGIATDNIYNLGDSIGYGPFPNEVVELLKEKEIKGILGNYDEAVAYYVKTGVAENESVGDKAKRMTVEFCNKATIDYLRSLPKTIEFVVDGKKVMLVHGSPNAIDEYLFEEREELHEEIAKEYDFNVLISGHTHLFYEKVVGGKTFTNTASVGKPKDSDPRAGYIVIDFKTVEIEYVKVPYNVQETIKAALEVNLPMELNKLLERGVGKL